MALINTLEEIQKATSRIHSPVRATVSVIDGHETKVVQIDTFGSSDREAVGIQSQTIQLDRNSASQLIDILRRTFPGL